MKRDHLHRIGRIEVFTHGFSIWGLPRRGLFAWYLSFGRLTIGWLHKPQPFEDD